MHVGEAVVLGAFKRPDGTQEVELKAVCPKPDFERLNVVLGSCRVAVPLDRPVDKPEREFKVTMRVDSPINLGDKLLVEFFYPGEQAGVH
ncbi:MAG: hypothetical protein JOY92_15335 [Verrucomicrobia bacterium]|jgi:hypothetical protein|nr:hypothetical protein [Verrucomicrobiota bacterium]